MMRSPTIFLRGQAESSRSNVQNKASIVRCCFNPQLRNLTKLGVAGIAELIKNTFVNLVKKYRKNLPSQAPTRSRVYDRECDGSDTSRQLAYTPRTALAHDSETRAVDVGNVNASPAFGNDTDASQFIECAFRVVIKPIIG